MKHNLSIEALAELRDPTEEEVESMKEHHRVTDAIVNLQEAKHYCHAIRVHLQRKHFAFSPWIEEHRTVRR